MYKKIITLATLASVLTFSMGTTAFAHGGGHGRNHGTGKHSYHSVSNCTNVNHTHYYNGQYHDIENCNVAGHNHHR